MQSARLMVAPMQSIVLADIEGNIALIAPARVPLRDPANMVMGRAPVPDGCQNTTGRADGFRPGSAIETLRTVPWRPPMATGCPTAIPATSPLTGTSSTADAGRGTRPGRIEKHSPETMQAIQADNYSRRWTGSGAMRWASLPQARAGCGTDRRFAELGRHDGARQARTADPDRLVAPHADRALLDDLGPDYTRFAKGNLGPLLNAITMPAPATGATTPRPRRTRLAASSCRARSMPRLAKFRQCRARIGKPGAGRCAHRIRRTPAISSVAPLARLFTVTRPSAGDSYTLLRARRTFRKTSLTATSMLGLPRLYDLGAPNSSQFHHLDRTSGHFLSRHYDDLADRWTRSNMCQ